VQLPFFNLRFLIVTLVIVLLVAGGVFGWVWHQRQPDTLYASAHEYFERAEKLREAKDTKKAREAYEKAQTQIETFLTKIPVTDPRASRAYVLKYKILRPLASIIGNEAGESVEAKNKAAALYEEAFRAGEKAALINSNDIEAQAIVLGDHFRNNDFDGAVPYARSLIDNLDRVDPTTAERDEFNSNVIGAYYVLARQELKADRPDRALEYLAESQKREEQYSAGGRQQGPRWRAACLEVQALQRKVDVLKKQAGSARPGDASSREAARKTEEQLNGEMQRYLDRAQNELKQTIPPAEGKPEMPLLATLTVTNVKGLIDLLLLSLRTADSYPAVQERAALLLDVCEKLSNSTGAQPHVYKEAVRGAGELARVNAEQPLPSRLKPEDMAKLQERVVAVNETVLNNGGAIDPLAYLDMSHAVQKGTDGRARALDLVKKGLKAASDQGIAPSDPRVVELQCQAAALLLDDHKTSEAEEYLTELARNPRLSPRVSYMQGLGAVLDGRLAKGVSKLKDAQRSSQFKDKLPLLLGLAHAYMGQGDLAGAVPVLQQLRRVYKDQQARGKDDEFWASQWLPTVHDVNVNLLRCQLELSLRAADPREAAAHFQRAKEAFAELQGTFAAEDALAAMIAYQLARLRAIEAKQPGSLEADAIRQDLHKTIDNLSAASRDDPRLLWPQVNVILSERVVDPAVVAGAVLAPLGAPTDLAVRLGETGRLRAGANMQWVKAEDFIMKAAARQADSMTLQVAWIRWLLANGRTEEALAKLSDLENKAQAPKDKRRMQMARARLLMASGQAGEADKIIKDLRAAGTEDLPTVAIQAEELLQNGNVAEATDLVNKALSKHDQNGMFHFMEGRVRQANGDFMQAIRSFERSLEFTQFRTSSQNGILACVLGIVNGPAGKPEKANPEAAFAEAKRLRKEHPADIAVLLAYAITARQMDEIYGDAGMEGALAELIKAVKEQQATNAQAGPYAAAQQWVAAGRPDRARQELKAYPGHLPSLMLATRLALEDEDWPAVAEGIKRVKDLQPNTADLPLWQALLYEAKGETAEAKKIYEQLVKDQPTLGVGYLALARVHESAKEYKEALEWVKRWRKEMPDEVTGAAALVRVLARDGQVPEAAREADAFIKGQLSRLRQQLEEADRKSPSKDKEQAEQRAKMRAEGLDSAELLLTIRMAAAFQEAKAWSEAQKWLVGRVQPLMEKLPESARKSNLASLKLALGTVYLEQGRLLKENSPERAKLMDQAIREYDEVWQAQPGNLVAGNNLAYLLVKEKGETARALALVEELRKGKYSQKPFGAERLPLEILDTVGVVYRSNGQDQIALNLFKEAMQRYARDPRIVLQLAQSQKALGMKRDAFTTFKTAIDLADERARNTPNPDRKADLARLIDEARTEQKQMGVVR
jgi:predicted Zn-dependent protease